MAQTNEETFAQALERRFGITEKMLKCSCGADMVICSHCGEATCVDGCEAKDGNE